MTIDPNPPKSFDSGPDSRLNRGDSPALSTKNPPTGRERSHGAERRRSRRIKDPILVFVYKDELGSRAARPLDLSTEGIGIDTAKPLTIGETLQIAIIIGESQINATGKIVYTRKERSGRFRSGIQFEGISDRNQGIIRLYLEKTQQSRRSGEDEKDL